VPSAAIWRIRCLCLQEAKHRGGYVSRMRSGDPARVPEWAREDYERKWERLIRGEPRDAWGLPSGSQSARVAGFIGSWTRYARRLRLHQSALQPGGKPDRSSELCHATRP
jgi:hypothetical protein